MVFESFFGSLWFFVFIGCCCLFLVVLCSTSFTYLSEVKFGFNSLIILLEPALALILVLVLVILFVLHRPPILVLVHVLKLVLLFVLENVVISFGSTNTLVPTVLGVPIILEGVTSLPTEHPTARRTGGRLHHLLCSVQGRLTDPLLLEEGLLKNALHTRC